LVTWTRASGLSLCVDQATNTVWLPAYAEARAAFVRAMEAKILHAWVHSPPVWLASPRSPAA
jgi:hypothetical protein